MLLYYILFAISFPKYMVYIFFNIQNPALFFSWGIPLWVVSLLLKIYFFIPYFMIMVSTFQLPPNSPHLPTLPNSHPFFLCLIRGWTVSFGRGGCWFACFILILVLVTILFPFFGYYPMENLNTTIFDNFCMDSFSSVLLKKKLLPSFLRLKTNTHHYIIRKEV